MKTFHLVSQRRKIIINLETFDGQSKFQGLEAVVRACVVYLLDAGRTDETQDLLMQLAIRAHRSPTEKSQRTAKERKAIRQQTETFLRDEGPPD